MGRLHGQAGRIFVAAGCVTRVLGFAAQRQRPGCCRAPQRGQKIALRPIGKLQSQQRRSQFAIAASVPCQSASGNRDGAAFRCARLAPRFAPGSPDELSADSCLA
jgi:hypothetical protein